MTTLTRMQARAIEKLTTETEKMDQELATLKNNAEQVAAADRDEFDENVRRMEAAHLALKNNLRAWEHADADEWQRTQEQINNHLRAYNDVMNETLDLLHNGDTTGSLGWVEGMAKSLQQRSEGWTEGMGVTEESSEVWTEGMGVTEENSEGWTEGMTDKATA